MSRFYHRPARKWSKNLNGLYSSKERTRSDDNALKATISDLAKVPIQNIELTSTGREYEAIGKESRLPLGLNPDE